MKQLLIIFIFGLIAISVRSQECRLTLTGHVEDSDSKEELAGATLLLVELNKELTTDEKGDFRYVNICNGDYTLKVTHAGCETLVKKVSLEKNQHLDILLPHLRNNLAEVIVEGKKGIGNTGFKQELSAKDIESSMGMSIGEMLGKINGVNMLQTGSTVAKPVIHGLHSSRILTINNGVRQEGQQWGNEHAPEIDPFIADKLTVVKGVDELKYGSDAIGGVILIDPKPLRHLPGYSADLNAGFSTNNNQHVFSGIFENQLKNLRAFSYRVQGTFKQAGNVNTPEYRLNNTGLKERNYSVTAGWKKEHYDIQAFYSEFQTSIGIFTGSHVGNLTDLQNAIAQPRPDDVFLGEKTYAIGRPRQEVLHRLFKLSVNAVKNNNKFNATFAGQYNHRDEFDVVRSASTKKPQISLAIITLSEGLSWEHPKVNRFKGTVGLSLMQQDNSYSGRYLIPNYFSNTIGGYWLEKWTKDKLDVEAGVRFDHQLISTSRLKYGGQEIDHDFNYSTLASSVNLQYRFRPDFHVNANVALANRAPHVNELLVDGIHSGTGTYERGNINLVPERSLNMAIGIGYSNRKKTFSTEVNLFNNQIDHFIYQQPKPDAPVLTIVGAFPLIQYQQANALLRGVDASVIIEPSGHFRIHSKASVLRAYNRDINDWLIFMPSDRWSNELTYRFSSSEKIKDSYLSAEFAAVFRPRVPGDNNGKQDYKSPPDAYQLANLNASATVRIFRNPVTVGVSVRNLFNKSYREYMNSFRYYTDDMGRNIIFRLRIPFEKRY